MAKHSKRMVRVVSDVLGGSPPLTRGTVVEASTFEDPERLIEMGAIEEFDGELVDDRPTLYDAMRSSSPPTLPNAPYVNATEHEKLAVAGALPPEAMQPEDYRRG